MTDPRVRNYPPIEDSEEVVELVSIEHHPLSSLMVSVDYLELFDRVGEEETWIVLGKLKDLLG